MRAVLIRELQIVDRHNDGAALFLLLADKIEQLESIIPVLTVHRLIEHNKLVLVRHDGRDRQPSELASRKRKRVHVSKILQMEVR